MFKSAKAILLSVAAACAVVLGTALYLQIVENYAPCPMCSLQRYAFVTVGLLCIVAAFLPARAQKAVAGVGMLAAITGAGIATWPLGVKAHPAVSCGIDPMETALNKIFTAQLLPVMFRADGFCTTEYPPFFGASIPQWSLAWFFVFIFVLGWFAFRRKA